MKAQNVAEKENVTHLTARHVRLSWKTNCQAISHHHQGIVKATGIHKLKTFFLSFLKIHNNFNFPSISLNFCANDSQIAKNAKLSFTKYGHQNVLKSESSPPEL